MAVPKTPTDNISFGMIQDYILTKYGINISKSSITQIKAKCGLNELKRGHKGVLVGKVSTEKEKLVLEAFKAFEIL